MQLSTKKSLVRAVIFVVAIALAAVLAVVSFMFWLEWCIQTGRCVA